MKFKLGHYLALLPKRPGYLFGMGVVLLVAVTGEVLAHTTQQSERIERSRQLIGQLAAKYTPQAVAAIAGNPDQATERLQFAAGSLTDAQQAMAADQAGQAAVFLQAPSRRPTRPATCSTE